MNTSKGSIVDIQVLAIFLLLPFLTLPKIVTGINIFPLFMDAFVLLTLFTALKDSKLYKDTITTSLFILFFTINVFYFFISSIPSLYEMLTAFRLTAFYSLLFIIPYLTTPSDEFLIKLYKLLKIVTIIVCLNAIRQWLYPFNFEIVFADNAGGAAKFFGDAYQGAKNSFRIYSTFGSSVHLVIYLCFINYLAISMIFSKLSRNKSDYFLFLLTLVTILLTYSRTGWLGYIVGLSPILLCLSYKKGALRLFSFGLLAIFVFMIFYFNSIQLQSRVDTLMEINEVNSLTARELLWDKRTQDILHNPWGYGTGAGSWSVHNVMNLGSDSNYLKFIIELGILGGAFALAFLLYCLSIISKAYVKIFSNKLNLNIPSIYIISILGFLVSVSIQMITNQVLEAYPSNAYFWYLLGLGVYLCKKYQF